MTMHQDDLTKTQILRGIREKAHTNSATDLRVSEGGHSLDARGLPLIGVLEIELRDEEERKDFLRRVEAARDVFKNAR